MNSLGVVILAAGDGTRMRSGTPKVLHPLLGLPLCGHVVRAARALAPDVIVLVVSPRTLCLRAALGEGRLAFALQDPPRGTGDAAARGMEALGREFSGRVLVLNGDCPGVRADVLVRLLQAAPEADATFMSVELPGLTGYGRVVRDERGDLLRIVEERDADEETLAIAEVNAGVYVFDAGSLRQALARLAPDNAQGEFYLTDTLELIRAVGGRVAVWRYDRPEEVHGVNDRAELARAERLLLQRKLAELMAGGVTVSLPETVRVDVDVQVGRDTTLHPGTILEGGTRIGEGCVVGPNARLRAARVADRVTILDGCVVEDAEIEQDVVIGPYARLRPGTRIRHGARVGNFVETKKTELGPGSKANHLTYLGDARVGEGVNVGAGTITCNYDGAAKHRTEIDDGAFIGSNTALVAPVRVGKGAYVAAGSTITRDVPDGALGIARGRQANKDGWAERRSSKARREGGSDE